MIPAFSRNLSWCVMTMSDRKACQILTFQTRSKGMVTVSNNAPDSAVVSDTEGVHASLPLFFFMERYTESYIAELKAFIECIQQDTEPTVTGMDGRIAVVMGHAAKKSYMENRPVRLNEFETASI